MIGIASQKFTITTEIRHLLLEDTELREAIGEKIFPVIAPQDTEGDFIFYYRDEYSIDRTKMGIAEQRCTIIIAIVSESYDRSQQLALRVFEVLDGSEIAPNTTVQMIDSTEEFADKKYLQVLKFKIN